MSATTLTVAQSRPALSKGNAEGEGEIVERADTADAEEADHRFLVPRLGAAEEAEPSRQRSHEEDGDEREDEDGPAQRFEHLALTHGGSEQDEQHHHQQALELLDEV